MVSIVLTTYNREKLLKEAIESIIGQTYADFELLIMDDGSFDGTFLMIEELHEKRIRYFQLEHSGHTGRLKNLAITQSRGEFIAFMDSDDLWKPDKLARQMKELEIHPNCGFSITDVTTFQDKSILIDHSYHLQHTTEVRNIFQWLKESRFLVYNPTILIRKKCLEKTGKFDEDMICGDYHFNMRLAYHFDAVIIYETLVLRRVHESNMSRQYVFENYDEYMATFEYLYRNKWIERKYLRKAKGIANYKMGNISLQKGNGRKARGYFQEAITQQHLNWKGYAGLVKSYFSRPAPKQEINDLTFQSQER